MFPECWYVFNYKSRGKGALYCFYHAHYDISAFQLLVRFFVLIHSRKLLTGYTTDIDIYFWESIRISSHYVFMSNMWTAIVHGPHLGRFITFCTICMVMSNAHSTKCVNWGFYSAAFGTNYDGSQTCHFFPNVSAYQCSLFRACQFYSSTCTSSMFFQITSWTFH